MEFQILKQLLVSTVQLANNPYMIALAYVIIADIGTGYWKSLSKRSKTKAHSTKGMDGLNKHLGVAVMLVFAYPLLELMGFGMFGQAFIGFYILNYLISILENLAIIGVPIPKFIISRLEKVKDLLDNGKDE